MSFYSDLLNTARNQLREQKKTNELLQKIADGLQTLADAMDTTPVGVIAKHDKPTEEVDEMPAPIKVQLRKKTEMMAAGHDLTKMGAPAPGDPSNFVLLDNEDGTVTMLGVSKAGNPTDISSVAKLDPPPESDTPAIVAVDPASISGMTFKESAVGPLGTATVAITVTWLDGSLGPFVVDDNVEVKTGPTASVVVTHNAPTPH
jgi:hypothetical protein